MFGSSTPAASQPVRYIGIPVQTSIKGNAIPRGWGTFLAGCNLIDYLDFNSVPVSSSSGGGKGFGASSSSTSYNYFATVVIAIVRGPIYGIRTVNKDQLTYVDGSTTALAQAGLSLALGSLGQAPWGALPSPHNLGYSRLAYVYAQNYQLSSSATLQSHSFEVQTTIRQVIGGVTQDDANPADILTDFFSDLPQWSSGWLGDLTDYGNYCLAQGLLLSPYLDNQQQVSDFLTEILQASNSDCFWSDGQLKIVPYGDTAITNNGVTWTPNLTPEYTLAMTDILSDQGDDPIKWDFTRPSDAYNKCQVEYLDRSQNYVTDIAPGIDQANTDQYGPRIQDPVSLHSIKELTIASIIAQIMVQRTCNVRRTATFELPELYGLLDPMDTIVLPLRNGDTRYCRITQYVEHPDTASIEYTVEEMLVGVGHAPAYSRQVAGGVAQNFNVAPGDAAEPVIFDVPVQLAQVIGLETWIAVGPAAGNPYWGGCDVHLSTDNVTYVKKTSIKGASRMGVLTANLPVGSDPDTVNTLSVNLANSLGELESGSLDDANNGATLCFVDDEYVSYEQATLTSAYNYNLGKNGGTPGLLRRGMWGSGIGSHSTGSLFVRLDDAVCKIPYTQADVGRTIWVKLVSFNVWGLALQDISTVTAWSHVVGGPPTIYAPTSLTVIAAIKGLQLNWVNAPNVGIAAVEIWRSASSAFSGATHIDDAGSYATNYNDQAVASDTPYWYWIRCRDIAGNEGGYEPASSGAGVTETTAQVQTNDIANVAVTAAKIDPAAVPALILAAGLNGVQVDATFPANNSISNVFFNTTDMQLYRWDSGTSSWTVAVPAVNVGPGLIASQIASVGASVITGQLIASQIASVNAGSVNTGLGLTLYESNNDGYYALSSSGATKTGGGTSWNENVYSKEFQAGTCSLSAQLSGAAVMVGITTTPTYGGTSSEYGYLEHAWYWPNSSQYYIYEGLTNVAGPFSAGANAQLLITYDGVNTRYYLNGTLEHTTATAAGKIFYMGVSGYQSGSVCSNLSFGAYADNSLANVAAGTITGTLIAGNTIIGSNIAGDTITADNMAANSITASKLFIGSVQNAILDPTTSDVAYWSNAGYPNSINIQSASAPWPSTTILHTLTSTSSYSAIYSSLIPVQGLDTVYGQVSAAVDSAAGVPGEAYLVSYDLTGAYISITAVLGGIAAGAGIVTVSGSGQVPSSAAFVRLVIQTAAGSGVGNFYVAAPIVRLMYTGDLIVDGSITTNNLSANAVEAGQIAANAVTSGTIASNAITAGTIAAGAINAGAIIVSNIIVTGHLTANTATDDLNDTTGVISGISYDGSYQTVIASIPVTVVNSYSPIIFEGDGTFYSNGAGNVEWGATLNVVGGSGQVYYMTPQDLGGGYPTTSTWMFAGVIGGLVAGTYTIEVEMSATNLTGYGPYPTYAPIYTPCTMESTAASLTILNFKR